MDVLKDITDGLRADDESTPDETERTGTDSRGGSTSRESSESHESTGESSDEGAQLESDGPDSDGPNGEDVHLCSFCEAEFDAERDACPECDARIVLRGAR